MVMRAPCEKGIGHQQLMPALGPTKSVDDTAITAVFLPLNLFTGFFGMNFDQLPLIHSGIGMWVALALLGLLAVGILLLFWRRRYLSHEREDAPGS